MDNDLNLPKALGKLFAFVRQVNRLLDRGELDGDQVRQVLDFMRQVNGVLDVIDFQSESPDAQRGRVARSPREGPPGEGFCHRRRPPQRTRIARRPPRRQRRRPFVGRPFRAVATFVGRFGWHALTTRSVG